MHGGVKVYRGNPAAARNYVEADHARVDDYYLAEGTGLAERFVATLDGVEAVGDLRHFYASGLIAAGCDVVTVQRSLGHAKATTTLNTYAHLWPTAEDRTRKAAQSIIDASLGD